MIIRHGERGVVTVWQWIGEPTNDLFLQAPGWNVFEFGFKNLNIYLGGKGLAGTEISVRLRLPDKIEFFREDKSTHHPVAIRN